MIQLNQKINPLPVDIVTGKTLQKALIQKESHNLRNYVSQIASPAFRASSVKSTDNPPGVETCCFTNGRNNTVATPSTTSSSHRASFN